MAERGDSVAGERGEGSAGAAYDSSVLGEESALFRSFVADLPAAVVAFEGDGTVAFANEAIGRMSGREPATLVSRPVWEIAPEGHRERLEARLRRHLDADDGGLDGATVTTAIRHSKGRSVPVALSLREYDHGGQRLVIATVRKRELDPSVETDDRPADRDSGRSADGDRDGGAAATIDRDAAAAEGDDADDRGGAATGQDSAKKVIDRTLVELRREAELRRERNLTEQLFKTVPVGVVVLSAAGVIERINDEAASILGVDAAEIVGQTADTDAWTLLDATGNHKPPEERAFRRVLETGRPVTDQIEIVERQDGERAWLLVNAAPMGEGTVDRVVIAIQDVTDQKERERQLREEKRFTESVFDAIPDLLYTIDAEGNFLRWNDRVEDVTGYDAAEIAEMRPLDLIAERDRPDVAGVVPRVVDEESVVQHEATIITKDGEEIPYEFSAGPLRDEDGDVIGVTGMARDVSERLAREERLARQNEQLERLDRINAVIRELDQALVDATTHDEIDESVCETFAATDPYHSAWIGDVNATDGSVALRTCTRDAALDDRITVESGVAVEAAAARSVAVTSEDDPALDAVDAPGPEDGVRSAVAVPLVYEDALYGVLVLYADRPDVFDETEREVLSELGATVGHAINAVTTRQALTTDRVTEITIRVTDDDHFFAALSAATGAEITFEGAVAHGGETPRYYATVTGADPEAVVEAAESLHDEGGTTQLVSVRPDGSALLETTTPRPGTLTAVTKHGGVVRSARAVDGEATLTVDVPVTSTVRTVVESIREEFDGVTLQSQRERKRAIEPTRRAQKVLDTVLTDRQRTAIETAYYAGFFSWPRDSTGEEVAETMGVSPPTFHKHLRVAERKLLAALFEGDAGLDEADP